MKGRHDGRFASVAALIVANVIAGAGLAACTGAAGISDTPPAPTPAVVPPSSILETPRTTASSNMTARTTTAAPSVTDGDGGWSSVVFEDGRLAARSGDWPMRAVAAGPSRIVAVGSQAGPSGKIPAIWVSDDGISWDRLFQAATLAPGELVDVTWHDTGFVAVGAAGQDAVAWLSDDGLGWESVVIPASRPGGLARMEAVVAVAGGVFAAGSEVYAPSEEDLGGTSPEFVGEDSDPAVWWSADGRSWERIEDPVFGTPGYQPNDGGEFNGRIVGAADAQWGVVFAGYASQSNPGWDYPPEFSAVWVLREEWERVDIGTDDQILGVAAADGTSDARGRAVVFGASRANPQADALLLVSENGRSWTRAGGDLAGAGASDGIQFVRDVFHAPGLGWIGVGSDEKDFSVVGGAAVWIAPDATPLDWQRVEHDDEVFGKLRMNPLEAMWGVTGWDDPDLVVVGGLGLQVDLGDGGRMCCEYLPSVWVWNR